jgi:hypothetical protein
MVGPEDLVLPDNRVVTPGYQQPSYFLTPFTPEELELFNI